MSYVESGAGVAEGGRTGLTALVTAGLFALTIFFVSLIALVGQGVQVGDETFLHPRARAVRPLTWLVAVLFVAFFASGWLSANVF